MIVVDTSVWVNFLRAVHSVSVSTLRDAIASDAGQVLVGDLVLLEVLQGARDDTHAARIERAMRSFSIVEMLDQRMSVLAARNFRFLRSRGITLRGTTDLIIGTYCLHHGYPILHSDRDFDPMVRHLGLISA